MSTVPYARVAAVTGANKGIGFAIVRQLALQYPSSAFNSGPLLIYLTSRDPGRGKAALEAILSDAQLKKAKVLRSDGGMTDVKLALLDVASKKSIADFTDTLKHEHGQIDFFISNAGIALKGFSEKTRLCGQLPAEIGACRCRNCGEDDGQQLFWRTGGNTAHHSPR